MPRNDREGGDTDNLRSNTGRKLNYDPHDLFSQIEIANIQRVYKRQGEHALVVECTRSAAASVTASASASASASLLDADTLSCTRRGTDDRPIDKLAMLEARVHFWVIDDLNRTLLRRVTQMHGGMLFRKLSHPSVSIITGTTFA